MIEERPRDPGSAERRALVEVLARAFRDNPMNRRLHGPDPRRRLRANRAGLRALVQDEGPRTVARVACVGGRVVGGFVLAPPGLKPLPRPSVRRRIGLWWGQGAQAWAGWAEVAACTPAYRPTEGHWYLALLGVDPAVQGRGLGSVLLAEIERIIAARPAPLCLECDHPASVRFYRGRGFAERDRFAVHGVEIACLARGFPDESGVLCDPVRADGFPRRVPPPQTGPFGP